jgi:hypothetical protein
VEGARDGLPRLFGGGGSSVDTVLQSSGGGDMRRTHDGDAVGRRCARADATTMKMSKSRVVDVETVEVESTQQKGEARVRSAAASFPRQEPITSGQFG